MKNSNNNIETAKTVNCQNSATFANEWPIESYQKTIRPKGKSKSYKDHFGNAISGISKTLNSPDAKNRETVPETFEQQVAAANKIQAEDNAIAKRLKAERKLDNETPRFANWSGNPSICLAKGRGPQSKY